MKTTQDWPIQSWFVYQNKDLYKGWKLHLKMQDYFCDYAINNSLFIEDNIFIGV